MDPGPDSDGDGTPDAADSDDDNDGVADDADLSATGSAVNPSAPDAPGGDYTDTNCDGTDGDRGRGDLRLDTGERHSPGTLEQPKRTLAEGVAAAARDQKDV